MGRFILALAVCYIAVMGMGMMAKARGAELQLECMTMNLYHEARGEDPEGIIAVGKVVINRVNSKRFPNTVCQVVHQGGEKRRYRCQFSWWCDGQSDKATDREAWKNMIFYAKLMLNDSLTDPSNGALFYHTDSVEPYWAESMEQVATVGNHLFYQ